MSRPRIACFHGGGSNSTIFSIQSAQLSELLSEYEFVFFDGPFERGPGPGVLPAFRNDGPFRSWFTTDPSGIEVSDGSGFGDGEEDGIERIYRLMDTKGPGGEWVGVMGFSQGTRPAGGVLLDVQTGNRKSGRASRRNIRFGILCMGGGMPMESENQHPTTTLITLPTLHVHGLKDMFLPLGQHQLTTYYDPSSATLYEIDYHHAMPWVRSEVEHFAELIRKMDRETR
ncbi:uncharacterized protein LDX57_006792 [Aspergillus melleus]|uniref:uncharacterized protein n=1 Tax=Aspergillus melleus TaxID=138277 RepID=UPI001E8D6CF4|nr:uncharacterized protein LDX57_006792 [Aspergillus melleus]KAH8429122.1 hypothetical protein LDX57_006792 [Aspergillus melleus]